jgi:mono/diheme cytochrome c family protein
VKFFTSNKSIIKPINKRITQALLRTAAAIVATGVACLATAAILTSAAHPPANSAVIVPATATAMNALSTTSAAAPVSSLSRGAYLARAGDCIACHTGPKAAQYAGGLPMHSPFGIIYTSNITPDLTTGIGHYTRDDFANVLRHGVRRDGTRLYPAMPFASYTGLTDTDITDLYNYFMHEVAPVQHVPPQTKLPFPFNQRWAMYFWDAAFVKHTVYKPHLDRDLSWNRGAYLVQTLGHCGSCHTPRGFAYQERGYDESSPKFLSGGVVDNWYASNLSGERAAGLGRRSEAEIAQFLRTGHASGDIAFGSMREVVEKSTQYLTEDDLSAIAHYLKSLPEHSEQASYRPTVSSPSSASSAPSAIPASASSITNVSFTETLVAPSSRIYRERPGAGVYSGFCAKCHGIDGGGEAKKFPALAGNPAVMMPDASSLIRLLVEGGAGPKTTQMPSPEKMPSFEGKLDNTAMADVLSYIRNSWGNHAAPVTVRSVRSLHTAVHQEDRTAILTQPQSPSK